MRIVVTEPCVVVADGPILVEPYNPVPEPIRREPAAVSEVTALPSSAAPATPPSHPNPTSQPTAKVDDFVAGITRPYNGGNPRKPMPRHRKVCINCGRTYHGTTQQMYCSSRCKHEFYDRGNKPREGVVGPKPIRVAAGAGGVTIS